MPGAVVRGICTGARVDDVIGVNVPLLNARGRVASPVECRGQDDARIRDPIRVVVLLADLAGGAGVGRRTGEII